MHESVVATGFVAVCKWKKLKGVSLEEAPVEKHGKGRYQKGVDLWVRVQLLLLVSGGWARRGMGGIWPEE